MSPSINGKLDEPTVVPDNSHKIRREDATGYIAPAFEGKDEQMSLGASTVPWLPLGRRKC